MYVALSLLSMTFAFLFGIFAGWYITVNMFYLEIVRSEPKLMKWDEGVFAYRPRPISAQIRKDDLVVLKAGESIVDMINTTLKGEE